MLPFVARQHFLEKGYYIVRNVFSGNDLQEVRTAAMEAAVSRRHQLHHIPRIETVFRQKAKFSDPSLTKMVSHLEKRRYILEYYRMVRRERRERTKLIQKFLKGRKKEDLSEEELYKLAVLIQQHVKGGAACGRQCDRTIYNDTQMLHAITEHRANLWMTNKKLEKVLRSDYFKEALGRIATEVGGVENPVIFSDSPLYREAYGGGVGYHCSASQIGIRTTAQRSSLAVTLAVFTFAPSPLCFEPHILDGSHLPVRAQLNRCPQLISKLYTPFPVSEYHVPFALQQQFPGLDSTIVGKSLLSTGSVDMTPGDVLVINPHLMVAYGPNFTPNPELVYRLHVVNEEAKPYLRSPSWIRSWRSLKKEVDFRSPIVFPTLGRCGAAEHAEAK